MKFPLMSGIALCHRGCPPGTALRGSSTPCGCQWAALLPAVQSPFPTHSLERMMPAGISSDWDPWKLQDDHDCQPAQD
jgi:hypothetical protein